MTHIWQEADTWLRWPSSGHRTTGGPSREARHMARALLVLAGSVFAVAELAVLVARYGSF
jgi:hypothetical protein